MKKFMVVMKWRHEEDLDVEFVEAESLEEAQEEWWLEYEADNFLEDCITMEEVADQCPEKVWLVEQVEDPNYFDIAAKIAAYEERLVREEAAESERVQRSEWERVKARYEELKPKFETTANK